MNNQLFAFLDKKFKENGFSIFEVGGSVRDSLLGIEVYDFDFATDARLRKAIKENTDNMTVFLVSQRVSTIRNADHILVLDDGKIAGIGTHLQLLKENQVYKEICASQMAGEEA